MSIPTQSTQSTSSTHEWTRTVPSALAPATRQGQNIPPPSLPISRSGPRLQRDVAPHHDRPSERFELHVPAHPSGSRHTLSRQALTEQSFYTQHPLLGRLNNNPKTSSRGPLPIPNTSDTGRASGRNGRLERSNRTLFKERGSLLSRKPDDAADSVNISKPGMKKMKKNFVVEKKVSADIYIPSTVTVGTLARLLGVRLGRDAGMLSLSTLTYSIIEHLQRRMRLSGMTEQANHDHSTCLTHIYRCRRPNFYLSVLTCDYAVLLAEEYGRNPIVNDEAAFDIYPMSVLFVIDE